MSLFVFNRIDEKRIGNANSDLNFFTNLPHFYLYLVELLRAKLAQVNFSTSNNINTESGPQKYIYHKIKGIFNQFYAAPRI